MNIANLMVTKGLVANSNTSSPQLIRVSATTADTSSGTVDLTWQNVSNDGSVSEPFATANILLGDASEWLASWSPLTHLIQGRVEALTNMAAEGKASRLSRNMAYTLFASNLVDYADKYRGMQSVVMHGLEGFADVQLTSKEGGKWTVPPYFIDSVAHLAGFIMNCSDAMDCKNNYCVTPGWKTMRFARPLLPGAKYRSYVKMIPTAEDPAVYFGDVYIMQDEEIIGMVGGIQFRSYPRLLLNRFFSPADKGGAANTAAAPTVRSIPNKSAKVAATATAPVTATAPSPMLPSQPVPSPPTAASAASPPPATAPSGDSLADKALQVIAREAAMEVSSLEDDASFDCMGIDSLLSLVIVEKLRMELDIKVGGSLFLDYPTIGDFRQWLDEYSP
jgi:monodictyphenone polyketide synthase